MSVRSMPHLAAVNNMVGTGERKETSRLKAALMREKKSQEVVCPKPRRVGMVLHPIPELMKPIRRHFNLASDCNEFEPAGEILDIFTRNNFGDSSGVGCSPPYFCGSPPTRADNPLVHDVQFIDQRGQISQSPLSKPKSSLGRSSFGPNPAVTIEGFDCSGRDTRCSIPALA